MRRALALALLAWPTTLAAEHAGRHAWGVPVEGSGPSVVSAGACEWPCAAVVRFDNTLVTQGYGPPSPVVRATLRAGGIGLAVTVVQGGGMSPDLLRVEPPPGYESRPREVLVEDGRSGEVEVRAVPTS